jgi:hypothetical protein
MAELADAIALGAIGETHGGSNPLPPISSPGPSILQRFFFYAGVAQLVERNLAKVEVTGSNPASRSLFFDCILGQDTVNRRRV